MGRAYGRVLDTDKKPVAFATATVLLGDSVVGGALVQENGEFDIPKLPMRTLRLKVAAMGYTTVEKEFSLTREMPELDLGNLRIEADAVLAIKVEADCGAVLEALAAGLDCG